MPRLPRALVIAHEPDGPGGQVTVRLRERGWVVDTHVVTADLARPNDAAPFPAASDYDILVPMGSIRSLTRPDEIDSWVYDELDMIREATASGRPVLGVCFGGQLIAQALGGSVEAAPVTEIGWYLIRAASGAENPVGPGPWMEWHHDRFTPPPTAQVLAETDAGPQLIVIDRTVGTQFHPEIDENHLQEWLDGCDPAYLDEHGVDREVLMHEVRANEQQSIAGCKSLVDWFLDDIAFPEGLPEGVAVPAESGAGRTSVDAA